MVTSLTTSHLVSRVDKLRYTENKRKVREAVLIKNIHDPQVWKDYCCLGSLPCQIWDGVCCKFVQHVWLQCVAGCQTNAGTGKEGMWGTLVRLHSSLCQLLIMLNYTFNTSGPLWTFLRVWGQAFPVSMNDPTSGELSCMGPASIIHSLHLF